MVFICKILSPFYLRLLYAKFGLNCPLIPQKNYIYIYVLLCVVSLFLWKKLSWLFPLEKWHGLSFEQTGIPNTHICFVPSLVEIDQLVLEKINTPSMYLHFFVVISPWKLTWPFISTNLNPLFQRRLCAKFVWN